MHSISLNKTQQQSLLTVAAAALDYGLLHAQPMPVELTDYPIELQIQAASFVTLRIANELRGCMGSLQARLPLVEDVAANAYAAAFKDPRFWPLQPTEREQIQIHISVLNPAEEMQFTSEADLLNQLRPDVDGLIIDEQGRRATFLPSVWESLPTAKEFLTQLKLKAGLPANYWSDSITAKRYTVQSFGE